MVEKMLSLFVLPLAVSEIGGALYCIYKAVTLHNQQSIVYLLFGSFILAAGGLMLTIAMEFWND